MKPTLRAIILSAIFTSIAPSANFAEDHFLVIGGGYNPSGNQVSLEKNVRYFERLLEQDYSDEVGYDLFFADGSAGERDLQYIDPDKPLPAAHQILARVFRSTKHQTYRYRNHDLPREHQAATKANIEKWFSEHGSKLGAEDRLMIYVTAHGGKSRDKNDSFDTRLYLWNQQYIRMKEFAGHLDRLDPQVSVVVVMVQCYSGGFGNLIYQQGDPQKGLAAGNRCGFFATVQNRVAAGCTPDINEENYREYSSYFWAAISGKTRTGKEVAQPDFNGDGFISFAEAHAYTVLQSTTIDIPTKTSGVFLRSVSGFKPNAKKSKPDNAQESPPEVEQPIVPSLQYMTADSPFGDLIIAASPHDRMVLEGLSIELGFTEEKRAAEARKLITQIAAEKKKLVETQKKKAAELTRIADTLKRHALKYWPELENRFNPRVDEILSQESNEFVATMNRHPYMKKLNALYDEMKQFTEKKYDFDRRDAKCLRLIRTLENVALEANLPLTATVEEIEQYNRLREAESGFFGVKRPLKIGATKFRPAIFQNTGLTNSEVYSGPVCD